jgi:hypothetical protein
VRSYDILISRTARPSRSLTATALNNWASAIVPSREEKKMYCPPASAFQASSPLEPRRAPDWTRSWSIVRDVVLTVLVTGLMATGAIAIRVAAIWT